jgi:hypothetical protein
MSSRTRKYTSAGQRKPPSKAGLPPKFTQGTWPVSPAFGLYLISVKHRQSCAECAVEIVPEERAVHNREDGTIYHLHCMSLRILGAATRRTADERKRVTQGICRLYEVKMPDALPGAVRAAALALLGQGSV